LTIHRAEVIDVDASRYEVSLDDGRTLNYDDLIVAAGATHSYFGRDEWRAHAPGLKTLADAFEIRARIVEAFERAEGAEERKEREAWLTFAIVGAGATGVELAGALVEIARHTLNGEFRQIDSRQARIVLLEAGSRLLANLDSTLSNSCCKHLESLGVEVKTGRRVIQLDRSGLTYEDSSAGTTRLATQTILWAAGVAASPLGQCLERTAGAVLDGAGRVLVTPHLTVPGHPEISVVGDLAAAMTRISGGAQARVPGVSPAAKQMGRLAAQNILRRAKGLAPHVFVYKNYGSMATVGRKAAVVQLRVPLLGLLKLDGVSGWLFWLVAHLYFLGGFRNRMVVAMGWMWAHFTFERAAWVVATPPRSEAPGGVAVAPVSINEKQKLCG